MKAKRVSLGRAGALVALAVGSQAALGSTYWQANPSTPDDWFDYFAWSAGIPTSSSSTAYIGNGGTATISYGTPAAEYLYLGYSSSSSSNNASSGTVVMSAGQLNSGSALYLGYAENTIGTFNQSGGQVTTYDLYCGNTYDGGDGVYQLSGTGALSTEYEYIGYNGNSGGTGQFVQTGGTNSVSSNLYLYNGSYSMSGNSTLTAEELQISSYSSSPSKFTQNGGSVSITESNSYIGYNGQATYTMTNGATLTSAEPLYVGYSATGAFSQTDSTVSLGIQTLYLGDNSNGSANYVLAGNSLLSTGNQYLADGTGTSATFTQTGGSNNLGSYSLYLGDGGSATYTMSGNSTLSSENQFIGYYYGSSANFIQSGGVNSLGNYNLSVGYNGSAASYTLTGTAMLMAGNEYVGSGTSAVFNQSGGWNIISSNSSSYGTLNVGNNSTSTGNGEYFLSGGSLSATTEDIGYASSSYTALFSQSGGTNTTGNLAIASGARYNLVAGALQVSKSFVNNGIFDLQNPVQQGLSVVNTLSLSGTPITGTGSLIVEANATLFSSTITQSALTIGGKVQIGPNSAISKVGALNINSGGTLDITDNALVIDYGTNPVNNPLAAVQGYIRAGAASNWNGPGLISSSAAGNVGVAIGYGLGSDPGVVGFNNSGYFINYDSQSILIRYTWLGDANLDGKVDASDMALMSANGSTWDTGDFNYDGQVNADDYALFDLGLAKSGGTLVIPLPEPGAGILLAFAALLTGARIRKQ
ncbi:MAG TPA: dockerin type I repeat-containing protein [Tepidisphaeraceae bacterium]|jgi:hypothetical protein